MKKTIYKKYCDGDNLTNAEISKGYEDFNTGFLATYKLGPEFRIMANELNRVAMAFRSFGRARNMKEFDA